MTDFEDKPNRDPDFQIIVKDWEGNDERTILYWIDERCREIVFHAASQNREFSTNIDISCIYENTKDMVDSYGSLVDSEYGEFVEKYENYLMERELLGE